MYSTCNDVQDIDGSPGEGHAILAQLLAEIVGTQFVFLESLLVQISGLEVRLHRLRDVSLL